MARLKLFDDSVAHLCYEYLHGGCDVPTKEKIYHAVHQVASQKDAPAYVFEIAYRIGYAHSALADRMCELTYKKKKKAIRSNLLKIIKERKWKIES